MPIYKKFLRIIWELKTGILRVFFQRLFGASGFFGIFFQRLFGKLKRRVLMQFLQGSLGVSFLNS